MQSLSPEHFAHLLPRQSGLCDGHSLSTLHVPGASTACASGGTSGAASGALPLLPAIPPPVLPSLPPAPLSSALLPPFALSPLPPTLLSTIPPSPPVPPFAEGPSPEILLSASGAGPSAGPASSTTTPVASACVSAIAASSRLIFMGFPKQPARVTRDRKKRAHETAVRCVDTRISLAESWMPRLEPAQAREPGWSPCHSASPRHREPLRSRWRRRPRRSRPIPRSHHHKAECQR